MLATRSCFAAALCSNRSRQLQEQITVERVLVDARVTDDRGNPITGSEAADFRVHIDGKPATVESADWIPETAAARELAEHRCSMPRSTRTLDQPAPRGPPAHLFLPDRLRAQRTRASAARCRLVQTDDWLDWLEPEDRVAVFSFDSHLKFRLDFTDNKHHINDAMEQALYIDDPPPPRIVPMPALGSSGSNRRRCEGGHRRSAP